MIPPGDENSAEPGPGKREGASDTAEEIDRLVSEGGYAEAISRAGCLLSVKGRPLPLAQFELKKKLIGKLGHLLPTLTPDQVRVIRGRQEVICRHDPERALTTLPRLLSKQGDQDRFLTLLNAVVHEYLATFGMTKQQNTMFQRIQKVLSAEELPVAN